MTSRVGERDASFRFSAERVYLTQSPRSSPRACRGWVDARGRTFCDSLRYHDPSDGLALYVGSPSLCAKRLWDEHECRHQSSIDARTWKRTPKIQRCGARFRAHREVSGLLHRERHSSIAPDPGTHIPGPSRRTTPTGACSKVEQNVAKDGCEALNAAILVAGEMNLPLRFRK